MNKAVMTRRFYRFEDVLKDGPYRDRTFWADRPMATLQRLAARIWSAERPAQRAPLVVAGRGTPGGDGSWLSYCTAIRCGREPWQPIIVLSRHQRNVEVLLHEMSHAMTPHAKYDHGPAFARTFVYLMATYAGVPGLLVHAEEFL
jgi:hypothetical protein